MLKPHCLRQQLGSGAALAVQLEELPAAWCHMLLVDAPVVQLAPHDGSADVVREMQGTVAVIVQYSSEDTWVAIEVIVVGFRTVVWRILVEIKQLCVREFLQRSRVSLKAGPSYVENDRFTFLYGAEAHLIPDHS